MEKLSKFGMSVSAYKEAMRLEEITIPAIVIPSSSVMYILATMYRWLIMAYLLQILHSYMIS